VVGGGGVGGGSSVSVSQAWPLAKVLVA
jgi:hypothetical protein